ncbi:MAG: methyltransferase domain-containing protein [Thermodesulfobacteriota bacterium]
MSSGAKFIDIGCGSGGLVIDLFQLFKNSSFVGVDPVPFGIEAGNKKIQGTGLENRVSLRNIGGMEKEWTIWTRRLSQSLAAWSNPFG